MGYSPWGLRELDIIKQLSTDTFKCKLETIGPISKPGHVGICSLIKRLNTASIYFFLLCLSYFKYFFRLICFRLLVEIQQLTANQFNNILE